ncbi:MAG: tetratricopeptide repeat protein [candidate division Zixibacteria bacterium]|nr:tetratricopeptide repeat protein [candidate division Zixibacteria bacterium]
MKTIFISYNHKDKVIARLIYYALSKESWADVEVFMDVFSIQPGEDIEQKCLEKVKSADLGIVILSEYTQKSEHASQEVGILLSKENIPKIYVALHESWEIPSGFGKTIKSFPLWEEKDPSEGTRKLIELVRSLLKPKEIGAVELINKASKLANQGKFDDALEYCERAIQIDPDYDEAHLSKVSNLRRLRRYAEALQSVNEALNRFPNHAKVLYYKAFLLYSMKRFREAVNIFDEVLKMTNGLDQYALYYKGRCLAQLGNIDEAINAFEACYKINSTTSRGRDALRMRGTLKTRTKIEEIEKEEEEEETF